MKRLDRRSLLRVSGLGAVALTLRAGKLAWAEGAPLATTTAGKISGVIEDGINVFKGVPYGGDTAKRRFMAPVAATPWKGVKECAGFATMAPQLSAATASGAQRSLSGVPGGTPDRGV